MIPYLLWAMIPKRYLVGAAIAAALAASGLVAWKVHKHGEAVRLQAMFDRGYTVARDSAREAGILREIALKDSVAVSSHNAAMDSARKADSAARHFVSVPRHTPRIEAVALPAGMDTSLVGVSVESTGEHFLVPRGAARYWFTADSLVGVAQQLLSKYAAANKQWAEAWADQKAAREASDSLVAVLQARVAPPPPKAHRRWPYVVGGIVVGLVAARMH